ncbi:MAG: 50S ribosomal protein L30 [Thermoanaerobaculia bacterium]|jgi:large subunit ribosomal protein L30|nr:50S ribosomal protein L30 [Thermoanaerobaculia bacterium]
MSAKKASKTLRIQQVRSPIGYNKKQRDVLQSLGLRRIRHVVEREDTPAVRGMVTKISHLVQIVED